MTRSGPGRTGPAGRQVPYPQGLVDVDEHDPAEGEPAQDVERLDVFVRSPGHDPMMRDGSRHRLGRRDRAGSPARRSMSHPREGGPINDDDLRHLRRCVEPATTAREAGDEPFGSVLVAADGAVPAEDDNLVASCGRLRGTEFELVLLVGCEPDPRGSGRPRPSRHSAKHCSMCAAADGWVRLGRTSTWPAAKKRGTGWTSSGSLRCRSVTLAEPLRLFRACSSRARSRSWRELVDDLDRALRFAGARPRARSIPGTFWCGGTCRTGAGPGRPSYRVQSTIEACMAPLWPTCSNSPSKCPGRGPTRDRAVVAG